MKTSHSETDKSKINENSNPNVTALCNLLLLLFICFCILNYLIGLEMSNIFLQFQQSLIFFKWDP